MANLLVGNSGCTLYEVLELFDEPSLSSALITQWTILARKLDTPPSHVEKIRRDILVDKISYSDAVQVLLEEWIMRNSTNATLGKLLEIIPESLQKLKVLLQAKIRDKAKCWIDLDNASQKEVMRKKFMFMGAEQSLLSLGYMIGTEKLESILEKNITQEELQIFFHSDSYNIGENFIFKKTSYYIDRTLTLKRRLNPAIFKDKCQDIFVIEGIEHHHLSILARPESTDVSSTQLNKVTCRFIHLEDEDDYKEIILKAKHPVHRLKYQDNDFIWLSTVGSRLLVTIYLSNYAENIPEENFTTDYLSTFNSRPISICSSPGMGKSALLAKMASDMRNLYPERYIIFLEIRSLMRDIASIESKMELQFARKVLASHALQDKLSADILNNLMNNLHVNFEIFLDGFDETPIEYLNVTKLFLTCLITSSNMRIYITSRPHMQTELELITEVISFDIFPFQKEDQVNFLCRFWNADQTNLSNNKHIKFASMVLESLEQINSDTSSNEFAGIPLQCYMLAEVYKKDARRYANLKDFNFNFTRCLYDLYEKFMDFKFEVMEQQKKDVIKMFHYREALNVLFPDNVIVENISQILSHESNKADIWFIPGIMELRNSQENPVFVHKSFAEYLTAEFVVNHLILHPMFERSVSIKFILDSVLGSNEISREKEITDRIERQLALIDTAVPWEKINRLFASPLFLMSFRFPTQKIYADLSPKVLLLLEQKNRISSLVNNLKRCLQYIESAVPSSLSGEFVLQHTNVCLFLNAALANCETKLQLGASEISLSLSNKLSNNLQQRFVICARLGFKHILQMLVNFWKISLENTDILPLSSQTCANLIIGAARNDDLELYKYCCDMVGQTIFKNVSYNDVSTSNIININFGYMHFYEALKWGNYKLTEYLINQFGDKVESVSHWWKFCLKSNSKDASNTINNKIRILKLLKHVLQEQIITNLYQDLPDEIAVELFISFCDIWDYVPSKNDVSFMSSHLIRRFTQDIEMDVLVNWLISKNLTFLLLQKLEAEQTLLCDAIFINILSPETLCKIYDSQMFDLGEILHESIICKRGGAMIETIIQLSGDVNMTDANKYTPLHWAAFYRKINSIRFLLSQGADVNCTEFLGNTPLHLILLDTTMPFNCAIVHECVQLLLNHNANVLVVNRDRRTPAGLCKITTATTEIHRQTISLLKRKQFINNAIRFWGSALEIYVKLFIISPTSRCGWLDEKLYKRFMEL